MNTMLSLYESAMLAIRLSKQHAAQQQNPSLVLTEVEAFELAESIIVDYITSKALYPTTSHRVEIVMRSKFPWWTLDSGLQSVTAILTEARRADGSIVLVPNIIEYQPHRLKRAEVLATNGFIENVIMEVEEIALRRIRELIPKSTWVVWHCRNLGNDFLIEEGEDYRILDWQRRMESGEWQIESDLFG